MAVSVMVLFVLSVGPAVAASGVLYVDRGNPSCSDTGSGTQTAPFCTIGKGASVATAGQTVQVSSGTYPEKVTVKNSGRAGSPIIFTAAPDANVIVSGQANGFLISGKSYVTVQNFSVTQTTGFGIRVDNSSNITITANDVSQAGQPVSGQTRYGIKFAGSTSSLVSHNTAHDNTDAGIFLDATTNGVRVSGNLAYGNARGYTRAAPGIDVRGYANTIDRNVSHDNEDSGLQFYSGSHDNLVVDNVTYNNGDHGIDNLRSTNQTKSPTVFIGTARPASTWRAALPGPPWRTTSASTTA